MKDSREKRKENMLEVLFCCISICTFGIGLWYEPHVMESIAACCDRPDPDSLIMDEASARITAINLVDAKHVEAGESPLFRRQNRIPIAKPIKW